MEGSAKSKHDPKSLRRALFIILPLLAVFGLVFIILSWALYGELTPLLVLPFIVLTPFPTIIVNSLAGGSFSAGPSQYPSVARLIVQLCRAARETALFVSSALGSSALILPFFLHHIDRIVLRAALLACCGSILLFVAFILYHVSFASEDDNY